MVCCTRAKMKVCSAAGLLCLVLTVRAWNHVSEEVLQDRLESAGYTLVACELSFAVLCFVFVVL